MSETATFIENAKAQLDKLGQDIAALEAKAKESKEGADAWVTEKADKLRRDWDDAKAHVDTMVDQEKAEWDQAKTDAQRQWNALQDAIRTYRSHVEDGAVPVETSDTAAERTAS